MLTDAETPQAPGRHSRHGVSLRGPADMFPSEKSAVERRLDAIRQVQSHMARWFGRRINCGELVA